MDNLFKPKGEPITKSQAEQWKEKFSDAEVQPLPEGFHTLAPHFSSL